MVGFVNLENKYRAVPDGTEYGLAVQASPRSAEEIDPSGGNVTGTWWALYIGTGGDVTVNMAGTGTNLTFANVPNGTWLPICCTQVYQTGTDASDILGMTG